MRFRHRLPNFMRLFARRLPAPQPTIEPELEAAPVEPAGETKPVLNPYIVPTRKEQAREICNDLMGLETPGDIRRAAAYDLRALKKKHKVSWEVLGVSQAEVRMMLDIIGEEPKVKVSRKAQSLSKMLHADKASSFAETISDADKIRKSRDLEVARLRGLGHSKAEIARQLGVSVHVIRRVIDNFAG